ncbi:SMI1/KNR4 family protein [Bacillus salacetis]|uniref:SMI1/KNR4 family protein n=1 Tax=Bacillus salacetis TaxID=2315464 RepID=UPI003BA1E884
MKVWRKQKGDIYKLKKISETQIKEAEKELQIKLPEEYIQLILEQNGGEILFNAHPLPSSEMEHINIEHIMGIGRDNGLLENSYLLQEWGMPDGLILLSGDGHAWTALDYRDTKENPPVVFIDNEQQKITQVAGSFKEFLAGLYTEEDPEGDFPVFMEKEWTLEKVKAALASDFEQEITLAFDYLVTNAAENIDLIREVLLDLLRHPILEVKQMAASVAHHLDEEGYLSNSYITEIRKILRQDRDIAYYEEMYFS